MISLRTLITTILGFGFFFANAANINWINTGGGNWSLGTNWSGGSAPGVNDTAVINANGTYTVTVDVNIGVAKIVVGGGTGKQKLMADNRTINVSSAIVINAGHTMHCNNNNIINGAGSITNNGVLLLVHNNALNVNVLNNDSIIIQNSYNTCAGIYTCTAPSVLHFDAQALTSLTFATGWTNNGKILISSPGCQTATLAITTGVLINSPSGIVTINPNPGCYGYYNLNCGINNQGTINFNYITNWDVSSGASVNTGVINIAAGVTVTVKNGTLSSSNTGTFNFGSATSKLNFSSASYTNTGAVYNGNGTMRFDYSTANLNVDTIKYIPLHFYNSTINSNKPSVVNKVRMTIDYNNTINANINNNDSIIVINSYNTMSGAYTCTSNSILHFDAQALASLTFANGWTNNGKILMTSPGCQTSTLAITSGVLINPPSGNITIDPNPGCYGYYNLNIGINNQGTINFNYITNWDVSSGASVNTGVINIAAGVTVTVKNGTLSSSNTGTFNFASATSKLNFSSATYTNTGAVYNGNGTMRFDYSTANLNIDTIKNIPLHFYYSTINSNTPTVVNKVRMTIDYNNTINANINNNDSIIVINNYNTMSGAYTCTSNSILHFDAQALASLTFANGWTNNGKILMTSPGCQTSTLAITTGVLINPPTGIITINPNPACYGYYNLNIGINNQGTINFNYTTNWDVSSGASVNTGVINIAAGVTVTVKTGVINLPNTGTINFGNNLSKLNFTSATVNWTGPIVTGLGTMYFESSTANMNVATLPSIYMSFYSSTLASTFLPTTSTKKIVFIYNNTITAAIFNTDTFEIQNNYNVMSGALTTSNSAVLLLSGVSGYSSFATTAGFTNNGKIHFLSNGCNGTNLQCNVGTIINASTGLIQSDPGAGCYGYNQMQGSIINQGTINVNYDLHWLLNAQIGENTGTIIISKTKQLYVHGGTFNYNGGSTIINGTGTSPTTGNIYYYQTAAHMNVTEMPDAFTFFDYSSLNSNQLFMLNNAQLQFNYGNTINANMQNRDTIIVSHSANTYAGIFTTNANSYLLLNGQNSSSLISFDYGWTNNGLIRYTSNGCNATNLKMNGAAILTNPVGGIILSDLPGAGCYGYHVLTGAMNNEGTLQLNYDLHWLLSAQTGTNTGSIIINRTKQLYIEGGTFNYNGGTTSLTGAGVAPITGNIYYYQTQANINVTEMPDVFTFFDYSILNSNQNPIINNARLQFNYGNTINANMENRDSVIISHSANTYAGNFTTTANSYLVLNGQNSSSVIAFNNSWTNNGLIRYTSNGCNATNLQMNGATILTNPVGGVILSDLPGAGCYGYHVLTGAMNNEGTLQLNYDLRWLLSAKTGTNTGSIIINRTKQLYIEGGTFNYIGGTTTLTGTGVAPTTGNVYYYQTTANINVTEMPDVFTFFDYSILNSNQNPIINNARLQFNYGNTINAIMENRDSVIISHSANNYAGNFTTNANSYLWFNGQNSSSVIIFNNDVTNNGLIEFTSNGCNFTQFNMASGKTLTNANIGIVKSNLPGAGCYGYHRMDGRFINNGLLSLFYPLYNNGNSFINNAAATINGNSKLLLENTNLHNAGTISPGGTTAAVSIDATIKNTNTAIWNIQIGGLTAITQHDQIINNFSARTDSVNGTLNISLINGFVPGLGDSVIIETHNNRVGSFSTINGASIPGGLVWNIFYRPNSIVLRAGNPPNLNITATSGANGNISPSGVVSVVYNATQVFNFNPNSGYQVDSVFVDGIYVDSTVTYTFANVQVDHTIHVTYQVITFPITATSGANGTVTPSGVTNVNQFASQTYTITPGNCYMIDSVIVDGNYIGNPGTYTFNNVNGPHTIYASFRTVPIIVADGPLSFCIGTVRNLDAGAGYANYIWSNGATSQIAQVSTSGTYTCTVTGGGGCTSSASVTVVVNPLPVVSINPFYPADNNHVCLNGNNINGLIGSSYGMPVGGSYSGTGVFCVFFQCYWVPSMAGLGTHTVTYSYTDSNGCSNTASMNVVVDTPATVNAGPSSMILCNTLVANLSGTVGGTANSATWSTNGTGTFGDSTALITTYTFSSDDSLAGVVTLFLNSDNPSGPCGNIADNITIYYNPNAIADAGPAEACVNSTFNVSGTISGFGANPLWTSTGTGNFANPNAYATTYTFSVADSIAGFVNIILTPIDPNGICTFTADTMKVWLNPAYSVNAGNDIVLCGINDTIATLNGSFSNAAQVTWSSSGGGTFSNIHDPNATYTLSAADRSNGYIFLSLVSDDPAGPCSAVGDNIIIKYKYANVDLIAETCGDTLTYVIPSIVTNTYTFNSVSFQWTTTGTGTFTNQLFGAALYNASNADIANGSTKLYFQLIDNANECSYLKDSMIVWYNPHYTVDAGADTLVLCADKNAVLTGSASANVISTTWTTSGSGTFANDTLLATTYFFSSTDTANRKVTLYLTTDNPVGSCAAVIDSIIIIIDPLPNASAGTNSPVCYGNDLNITGTGGTTYSWSGPNAYSSTLQNIVRSPADLTMNGTYTVTVTDTKGCSATATTVADVQVCGCIIPQVAVLKNNVNCFGGNNAFVILTISTPGNHTFNWSNGSTAQNQTNLVAGFYTVTVTNIPGCDTTITIQIIEPLAPLVATCSGTDIACNGSNTGVVFVNATGGTGPYNYLWNNGVTNSSAIGLYAGTYTVIVTDAKGCTSSCSRIVSQPSMPLSVNCSGTNVTCLSANNGTAQAIAAGGTSPYTYLWSNGFTGASISSLAAGTYSLTATDTNGCTATCSYTITQSGALNVTLNTTNVSCGVANSGQVEAIVSGGSSPYTYLWSNGSTTSTNIGLAAGTYTVNVTDANGCTKTGIATVSNSGGAPAQPGVISGVSPVCRNSSGNIYSIVGVPGATSYLWTAGAGATIMSGQGSTSISVSISNTANANSITVAAVNLCGSSTVRVFKYSIGSVPLTPGIISGQTYGLCNGTNKNYNINPVTYATSYFWTVPAGANIVSGQGTTQIAVNFTNSFTTSGKIKVRAINACGQSADQQLNIVAKPSQPKILGSNYACQYQQGVTYSITPVIGATSYVWTIVSGSTLVSGQGTSTIVVNWGSINGVISCRAINACGQSVLAKHPVSFTCTKEGLPFDISDLQLLPNPTNGLTTIQFTSFTFDNEAYFEIYNIIGAKVYTENISATEGENKYSFDANRFAPGCYTVKLKIKGSTEMLKMIVN